MPKLSDSKKAARIIQAMRVFSALAEGVSLSDACEQNGITVQQYNATIIEMEDGDILKDFTKTVAQIERRRLLQIVSLENQLLEILAKSIGEITSVNMAMKVFSFIHSYRESLEAKHGLDKEETTAEAYLASLPQLQVDSMMETIIPEKSKDLNLQAPEFKDR